jgi:SAM-dependent MidA family methyltransferase
VEASPALQKKQAQKLQCKDEDIANIHADGLEEGERDQLLQKGATTPEGIRVRWYRTLGHVQATGPVQLVAQELFDALPVHVLEYTAKGWREVLVDVDPTRFAAPSLCMHAQPRLSDIDPSTASLGMRSSMCCRRGPQWRRVRSKRTERRSQPVCSSPPSSALHSSFTV